jgi:hypothetical protein
MTVGQERAHPEFLSQGACLPIVLFGLLNLKRLTMSEALTEEPVCPGLVAPLLMDSGEIESTCGELPGILQAAGQERGLAQSSDGDHMAYHRTHGGNLLDRLRKEWERCGESTRIGQGAAQA